MPSSSLYFYFHSMTQVLDVKMRDFKKLSFQCYEYHMLNEIQLKLLIVVMISKGFFHKPVDSLTLENVFLKCQALKPIYFKQYIIGKLFQNIVILYLIQISRIFLQKTFEFKAACFLKDDSQSVLSSISFNLLKVL